MNKKNTLYILRTTHNDTYYYVYNRRLLLHYADMAKKFTSMKAALRFYKSSDFYKEDIALSVVPYELETRAKSIV